MSAEVGFLACGCRPGLLLGLDRLSARAVSSWTEPEWLAEAHGWIREQVASLGARVVGELDQHHIQPWATVMRVPTDRGDVHFKATPRLFATRLRS